jgi:hypothetical protein
MAHAERWRVALSRRIEVFLTLVVFAVAPLAVLNMD